jgi:beta-lactamase superfamily II metal-dependent hydrolase
MILSRYLPDWIMYPGYYKDSENAAAVVRMIRKHEQKRQFDSRPLRRLSVRVDRVESRRLANLSKRFQYELFSPHIEDMSNSNCCSIVLKLTGVGPGGFSYLITGDTENSRWERINQLFGNSLKSDVLAAPHHGSRNAANGATMLLVQPNTVLISAGVENQYGHPDAQAVHAYAKVARHVFATNVKGGVSLFTKQSGFDFVTQLFK